MSLLSHPQAATPVRFGARHWGWPSRWTIVACGLALLIAAPVISVLINAFGARSDIWQHLVETVLSNYVTNSLLIMTGVTIGVLIVGVPAAWMTTLCRFPGRRLFDWALLLPMAFPAYVIAYAYTGLLDYAGPVQTSLRDFVGDPQGLRWLPEVRSLPGAIVMLVLVLYPYVYLLARAAFLEQSVCVLEVSRTLGCSPWSSFRRVALPLARPAIAAGVALALMEALNDYGTVSYFGINTLVTGIFRVWRGMGDPVAASQIAVILLLFVFTLLAIERSSRGRASYAHSTARYRPLPRYKLRGWAALGAIVGCAVPVVLGFALPAVMLLHWALSSPEFWQNARFLGLLRNSFLLAGLAALLVLAVAVILAYALRLHPTPATRLAVRVASAGYAVPGAVLAIGVLLPLASLDHIVANWAKAQFGWSIGLVFTGTLAAVTYAYLARFLTISFSAVEASLAKITISMDLAARSLGRAPSQTLGLIHLPIMRGTLLTAAILVFVDVLKELPATLVLRPFNFDTLATRTYDLASDERLVEAAGPALAIGLVGILPVYLLSRAIRAARPGAGKDQ
ncbi:ABC transporter permease [Dongia deserti]|uniref:ABC transporter permease n=1 Tax=Dongia deserti TaxID=2268030 RepID=UPI00254858A9|nr:iron ABC transporter permease [Dongia deserti]